MGLTIERFIKLTWMVAPLAYQKGPLTPYSHATLELCKMVAAHVHWNTKFKKNSMRDLEKEVTYNNRAMVHNL